MQELRYKYFANYEFTNWKKKLVGSTVRNKLHLSHRKAGTPSP